MLYRDPHLLFLLFLTPLLLLFYALAFRGKKKMLHAFGEEALIAKLTSATASGRQAWKAGLLVAAFVLIVIALSRPLWGTRLSLLPRKGVDIVIALDASVSMLAEDISPSRIKRARYEIARFVDRIKGDRVGLVGFAGDAFVPCPLTTDYGAFKMQLEVLDPASISAQGTAISRALSRGTSLFNQKETKYKVLVLITDGEDNLEDPVDEAKKAAAEGVIIYALGIGTRGGVPIPVAKQAGGVVYKKDGAGNTVLTSLNEEMLDRVASAAGGKYFHSTGAGLELDRIYAEIEKMEKKELQAEEFDRYNEQFMWPLAAALLLLILEYFTSSRRKRKLTWDGRFE